MADRWTSDLAMHESDCVRQSFGLSFLYVHVVRAVMIARGEKIITLQRIEIPCVTIVSLDMDVARAAHNRGQWYSVVMKVAIHVCIR